jgi:hypothetical protein
MNNGIIDEDQLEDKNFGIQEASSNISVLRNRLARPGQSRVEAAADARRAG